VVADECVQLLARCGLGWQRIECLLLALCGHGHALAHYSVEQRAFAFEVVEGRAAVHAGSGCDIAGAGGIKALGAEQAGGAFDEGAAAVAVVELFHRFAGAAPRAAGFGGLSGCGGSAVNGSVSRARWSGFLGGLQWRFQWSFWWRLRGRAVACRGIHARHDNKTFYL